METGFARQYYEAARSDHWWFRGRVELVRLLVERFGLESGLVLDLGAGSNSLFGQDFNIVKLDIARPEGALGSFVRASATSLPFGGSTFQGVGAFDLIEHVASTDQLLGEAHRVIVPGGFIIGTVPAHQFLWSKHDIRVGHVRRYTKRQVVTMLEAAGFDVPWCGAFYGFLLAPAVIRKLIPSNAGMGSPGPTTNRTLTALARRSALRAIRGRGVGLSIAVVGRKPGI